MNRLATAPPTFSYDEMTSRNPGFVSTDEQRLLRETPVFVAGVGGMGGACLQSLVRSGMERFELADFDTFEVSNLNRQLFATLDTVGREKIAATVAGLRAINPGVQVTTHGAEWVGALDTILGRCKIAVNGMDDLTAGIALYRKAHEHGATVVDAYSAPLPSVTRVRPQDPRPEERLRFPTAGKPVESLTADDLDGCRERETIYAMLCSSSAKNIDLGVAAEWIAGKRQRPSFAPMVIVTGTLMAFETVGHVMGRPGGADCRGYFFNPWRGRVERPLPSWAVTLLTPLARRRLRKLLG